MAQDMAPRRLIRPPIWLLALAGAGLALAGWLSRQRESFPARMSLVEAAQTYSERKTTYLMERFTTAEQWLRIVVGCVRTPCSEEVHAVAVQHAGRALDDFNGALKRFVRVYRGLLPSRD